MKKKYSSSFDELIPDIDFFSAIIVPAPSDTDDNNNHMGNSGCDHNIIIIRGNFAQPFVDIIEKCCQRYIVQPTGDQKDIETIEAAKHRIRTLSHRNKNKQSPTHAKKVVIAPPLSKNERNQLNGKCHQLYETIPLPGATLLVHIRLLNKGTLHPGMKIISFSLSADVSTNQGLDISPDSHGNADVFRPLVLGIVTSGSFSVSRGVCHGIGVVGASIFLWYLINHVTVTRSSTIGCNKTKIMSFGRISCHGNGIRSRQLLVGVQMNKKDDAHKYVEACMQFLI